MPWLSESDIKDIPPVIFPVHQPTLLHLLCLHTRHEITFTTWPSITRLHKYEKISPTPSSTDTFVLGTGYSTAEHK